MLADEINKTIKRGRLTRLSADILCGRPPDLCRFEPKIVTPVSPALGNVRTTFGVSAPFRFRVRIPYYRGRTDGRTSEQTGKTRSAAY